jgi:ATP-dependent Clp protease ATP-binding subunit ClpB
MHLERRVKQLEIEREALKREKDDESAKRLEEISKELSDITEERNQLRGHWQLEKDKIQKIRDMKTEIENTKAQADKFEREGDLGKVAELRYGRIIELEKQLKLKVTNLIKYRKTKSCLKKKLTLKTLQKLLPNGQAFR